MNDTATSSISSSDATVTIRLIKSFEYKNFRNVVFHNLDVDAVTLEELTERTKVKIKESAVLNRLFPDPDNKLDTLKLYYTRHAAKTNNPIINVGDDDRLVFRDYKGKSLRELGVGHECEISWFNWEEYSTFCSNPQFKWE